MKALKRLSLVAAAAMALMAAGWVPAASAAGFEIEGDISPALFNTDGEASTIEFTLGATTTVLCNNVEFRGEINTASDARGTALWNAACYVWGGGFSKASVTEICPFTFDPQEEVAAGVFDGEIHIRPVGCDAFTFKLTDKYETMVCEYDFVPQTMYASFSNENDGLDYVGVDIEDSLHYIGGAGSTCPGPENGTAPFDNSVLEARAEHQVTSEPMGIEVTDTETGLSHAGEEFALDSPTAVLGSADSAHGFVRGARTFSCSGVEYASKGNLGLEFEDLELEASYSGCTSNLGGPATIDMNGCTYVFNAGGSMSVDCPGGAAITLVGYTSQAKYEEGAPACSYKIGPQSGLESVTYTNVALGSETNVDVGLALSGISSTKTFGGLFLCGQDVKSGTYTGNSTLYAS